MKWAEKKEVRYGVGAIGIGVLVYGLYRLYRHLRTHPQQQSLNSSISNNEGDQSMQSASFISQSQEHCPYDILLEDAFRHTLPSGRLISLSYLRDISYRVILSLMKGNSYQGVMSLSFFLEGFPFDEQGVFLDFSGSGIKYLMVNGQVIEAKDIRFEKHKILLERDWLKEDARNSVEVIFQNLYSFLDEGLSTYFTVDEQQKYSLRQQVMFTVGGWTEAPRLLPCFNCLNECRVQLQVIHSDTFQVFSNTSKSLERLCSAGEYQKYPFLFDLASSALNKSFKLNDSTLSHCSESLVMSYSSANYYNRKKANSHFYQERLPCLHHLFLLSSSLVQLQPAPLNHPLDQALLIRYFCKHTESHRLLKSVNKVHQYITDAFRRLNPNRTAVSKIDILIVNDRYVEGYFAPGVILISEDTLREKALPIRCLYLLVRALVGLLHLQKGSKLISLKEILALNQTVFLRFQEFRNYLLIKNKKYQRISSLLQRGDLSDFIEKHEGHFLRYFAKQLRFIILENCSEGSSSQLNNLMKYFEEGPEQFWECFIANISFFSPLIIEPLVKLGLRGVGLPKSGTLLEQVRSSLSWSKYLLSFYSNEEISESLPRFLEAQAYGLEERLTQVKVKQKFKDFITQKYEMYLPIRSNMTEAEALYLQFKQFNQTRNFHHISVLQQEVKRIRYFGKHFLQPERVPIHCSLMGWKLLSKLKIYPQDPEIYQLIQLFEGL